MKHLKRVSLAVIALLFCISNGQAWHLVGKVKCPSGLGLENVVVSVSGTSCNGAFSGADSTDIDGIYEIALPECDGTYTAAIDVSTLPAGVSLISAATVTFSVDSSEHSEIVDFFVDGPFCGAPAACWFTGGGAKIDPVLQIPVAQKGKWINFGGNVYPGCSPTAGDGGNWNHIDRLANAHFQGRTIQVVDCGNVTPPPPPGSTSPVTPFNYIEWKGVGTVKGIQGNKLGTLDVYFNARTEDRNEPGSKDSNAGSGIDRYYLHVFTDPADPVGSTVLLVNGDAHPLNVMPVEIDHGNFQLHVSSCDNPPAP